MTSQIDLSHLRTWCGREEVVEDGFELPRARQLAATLNRDPDTLQLGSNLPPLWHWIYGTPVSRLDQAGSDGHTAKGGFLPPVPLPRRMWAAGRFEWNRLPRLGQAYRRISRVESVEMKSGKSGQLVFVGVKHEIEADGELALTEWHDIVYRDMPQPSAAHAQDASVQASTAQATPAHKTTTLTEPTHAVPSEAPLAPPTRTTVLTPNDVLLFRYSALTFNSHRIHYDRHYCREVEGYPGLVVHGPLMATLLATQAWDEAGQRTPRVFSFRAKSPVFDGTPIAVCSAYAHPSANVWIRAEGERVAMEGKMAW
jgi:3-methylfumaryl-CoA hydratase